MTSSPPAPTASDPSSAASATRLAPEKLSLARRHFDAGEQAFRDRKYDVALDEFTTAYEISKEPDLLYNLHKVALKLGQKEMALSYLREYRAHRPASEQPAIDREIADVTAADVKPEPAEITPPPAPPPPPPPLPPPPSELVRPPRSAGLALISVGAAFAVGGAAILAVGATTTPDGGAGTTHGRGMLVSGGFLAGTGVVAIIGGVVITLKSRSAK